MSAGHRQSVAPFGLNSQSIDRLTANEHVRKHLHKYRKTNRDHDIPFLSGHSIDGGTVYIDRDLPENVSWEQDGRTKEIEPDQFIEMHEAMEHALMEALGYGYEQAHQAAMGYARRAVIQRHGPGAWDGYSRAIEPYIKGADPEGIESVPKDLDLAPYKSAGADGSILDRMKDAQSEEKRYGKGEAEYVDEGTPQKHCGPVHHWPGAGCEHFDAPTACHLVKGKISPEGVCRLLEAKE